MNILITGTSRGLGEALAREYLSQGNTVFGISRASNPELLNNKNYIHLSMDLNKDQDMTKALRNFIGEEKIIDLVILNAGILPEIDVMINIPVSEIKKVMQVNVWANKYLLDALFKLRHEVQQIIAISTGAAVSGARGWNAYAISKAALNMMISLYSKEFPQTHFTALAPGVIDTGMQDYLCSLPEEKNFPVIQRLKEMREKGEMLTPEEAATNLIRVIPLLKGYDSGEFVDIREI